MSDELWKKADELFNAALEVSDSERDAFLREQCGDDTELLEEVRSLLRHRNEKFLADPSHLMSENLDSTQVAGPQSSAVSGRIGPYRLLQELGKGGMGVVYEAEQEEPVRRRVALKVIKAGMDSEQVIARFEAERQALALMNHPNVAKVFDAGTTEQHRPYFAMELVKGVPINEYCDRQRLTTRERLKLVMQVCAGVQHAHQKGIIHRDLKPSNVLIQTEGDERIPKIIDFGVAKATGQRLTERTMFTELGVMVGTPEYMSPEQAEMTGEDIDTRTDVYSLGVLLYELLVGVLPFGSEELRKAGFDEIRRKIREDEPAKPSARLSTLGDVSTVSAKRRGTNPRTLGRQLTGDLDWITMCAMEKDRTRRYNSPSELAADVGRHLRSEPIVARRPGTTYLLRKFVRRNRTLVGGALATFAVLIAGIVVSLVQRHEAIRQRDEATRQSYLASMVAVEARLARGEVAGAKRRLDASPEELRGWEWSYFSKVVDQSLATLTGHESWVESVSFSPDGTMMASASHDGTVRLWDVVSREQLRVLEGHDGEVWSVVFSADGTRIASASRDQTIRLWNTASGELTRTLAGHEGPVGSVSFSPDGARLTSASTEDKTVRLWDVGSGELLATHRGADNIVACLGFFTPDGFRIASQSRDWIVRIWDAEWNEELVTLTGHTSFVNHLALGPDGTHIATASNDRTVRLWNAESGDMLKALTGHEARVSHVVFSPDGKRLISGSEDKTVRLWDIAPDEAKPLPGKVVRRVEQAVENGEIPRSLAETQYRKLRNEIYKPLLATLVGHDDHVWSVAFAPDGARIASSSKDGTLRLWDATPVNLLGHYWNVMSVDFSPDGTRLVSGGQDETVRLWSATSGALLATLPGSDQFQVMSVAFGPNGARVVSGAADKTVRLWDAASGELLRTMTGHEEWVMGVAFSPDGTRLASGSNDKTLRLWDAETGESLAILEHEAVVNRIGFSPDGDRIASSSGDGIVRVWDVVSGELLMTLEGHDEAAVSVVYSPDGTRIASGSGDRTLRVWDAASGDLLMTLEGHDSGVHGISFSPDGTRIASGSSDRTVRLWDTASGELLATLAGPDAEVWSVDFSPDGSRIVSAYGDAAIRLWP